MRFKPLAFLILVSCGASAAFPQSPPPAGSADAPPSTAPARRHEPIWTLDVNHDGMLSRDELQSRPGILRHFDEIDTNHDGYIDRTEWRAWHQSMKARRQQSQTPAENSSG